MEKQIKTAMEINIRYVVYRYNNVMDSNEHKALERVSFKGFTYNHFETEQEAINALIADEKFYQDYVILKEVFITNR